MKCDEIPTSLKDSKNYTDNAQDLLKVLGETEEALKRKVHLANLYEKQIMELSTEVKLKESMSHDIKKELAMKDDLIETLRKELELN